jgi:hypothetical protein
MMWISKYKYERIIARLDELESATRVPATGGMHVGTMVYLLMQHFKLSHERTLAQDRLVTKGGPERGE